MKKMVNISMSKWNWNRKWRAIWEIKRCIVMFMIGAYGTKNFIDLLYRLTSQNIYIGAAVALISDVLRLRPVRELMFFAPIAYICICVFDQIDSAIEVIQDMKYSNRTK